MWWLRVEAIGGSDGALVEASSMIIEVGEATTL